VAIGRVSGGTPAKPGFLRQSRKKCAQNQKVPLNLYQDYVKFGIFPKSELLANCVKPK
jgi:hypothetical protein